MNKRSFLATIGMALALGACSTTNPNTPGADPMAKRGGRGAAALAKPYLGDKAFAHAYGSAIARAEAKAIKEGLVEPKPGKGPKKAPLSL